jgi:hypothetical protein
VSSVNLYADWNCRTWEDTYLADPFSLLPPLARRNALAGAEIAFWALSERDWERRRLYLPLMGAAASMWGEREREREREREGKGEGRSRWGQAEVDAEAARVRERKRERLTVIGEELFAACGDLVDAGVLAVDACTPLSPSPSQFFDSPRFNRHQARDEGRVCDWIAGEGKRQCVSPRCLQFQT